MCSDNFHLRLVLSSLSKYFFCVLLWILILRNEVKGEIKLQRESRNILHRTNMRWDVREWEREDRERKRQWGEDREELIKRRIEVWVVLGLKHLLSFSMVSLSIFLSWRLPHRTLWCSLMVFSELQHQISALCFESILRCWLVVSHLIPFWAWPNFLQAPDLYTHINL